MQSDTESACTASQAYITTDAQCLHPELGAEGPAVTDADKVCCPPALHNTPGDGGGGGLEDLLYKLSVSSLPLRRQSLVLLRVSQGQPFPAQGTSGRWGAAPQHDAGAGTQETLDLSHTQK